MTPFSVPAALFALPGSRTQHHVSYLIAFTSLGPLEGRGNIYPKLAHIECLGWGAS